MFTSLEGDRVVWDTELRNARQATRALETKLGELEGELCCKDTATYSGIVRFRKRVGNELIGNYFVAYTSAEVFVFIYTV